MQTGDLQSAVGLLASFDAQQTVDEICAHAGGVNILWQLACGLEDARIQTSDTHPSAYNHMPGLSRKQAEQSKECNVLCKEKEKTTPFDVNWMRSQVFYWAAQCVLCKSVRHT